MTLNAKDITRAMEYTHSVSAETFAIGAYTVNISQDDCAANAD